MLLDLKVTNFAIINELTLTFGDGLNIISGETGAGKSVLLKSLSLLMGAKSEGDIIRSGADQAVVEGLFDISERPDIKDRLNHMGIPWEEDTLIVRRILSQEGKSKAFINGHLSPLSHLRDLVAPMITVTGHHSTPLIEMTGQHDNRHLQSPAYHLDLLDQFIGAGQLRDDYHTSYAKLQSLKSELEDLQTDQRMREQRLDFLRYNVEEIRTAGLNTTEDETLESKVTRLRNSQRLAEFTSSALDALYGDDDSVSIRLHQVLQRAQDLKRWDESLATKLEPLTQAKMLVEDVVYELREYSRDLTSDHAELESLEARLSQIRKLQKKFGESTADILSQLQSMEAEVLRLESADERIDEIEGELKSLHKTLESLSEDLHRRRQEGSTLLIKEVNEELKDLNMKGVLFGIDLKKSNELGPTGCTIIQFTIQPSAKEDPRPLAKVASGGELSRILLSLKRALGNSDQPRTYLFDEVDTGVSGQTAEKVGRKLKEIAKGQQVVCVTHLAQVAAFADRHFRIEKSTGKSGTVMKVMELDKSNQVEEIARLISGEKITKTSLDHAKELIKECRV